MTTRTVLVHAYLRKNHINQLTQQHWTVNVAKTLRLFLLLSENKGFATDSPSQHCWSMNVVNVSFETNSPALMELSFSTGAPTLDVIAKGRNSASRSPVLSIVLPCREASRQKSNILFFFRTCLAEKTKRALCPGAASVLTPLLNVHVSSPLPLRTGVCGKLEAKSFIC